MASCNLGAREMRGDTKRDGTIFLLEMMETLWNALRWS